MEGKEGGSKRKKRAILLGTFDPSHAFFFFFSFDLAVKISPLIYCILPDLVLYVFALSHGKCSVKYGTEVYNTVKCGVIYTVFFIINLR